MISIDDMPELFVSVDSKYYQSLDLYTLTQYIYV